MEIDASLRTRIAYVVSVPQYGVGGHYHSLAAIAGALASANAVAPLIVTVGRMRASPLDVLQEEGIPVAHVPFFGPNVFTALRRVATLCRDFQAQAIHAFDEHAYLFARFSAWKMNVGAILTKCGGRAPQSFFPTAEVMTVFSEEDRQWFETRGGTKVHLIPNRVRAVSQDPELIRDLRERLPNDPVILRVSRIGTHYEKTIRDSINLVGRLRASDIKVVLIIVGQVYDQGVFDRLKSTSAEWVVWVTEERFTRDAKRIIDIAEIVIGTGRSLMEAVTRGRTVLCPVADLDVPCLLTARNFSALATSNFSDRAKLHVSEATAVAEVVTRLASGQTDQEKAFLAHVAAQVFDVEAAIPSYRRLYRSHVRRREPIGKDFVKHLWKVVLVFVRQWWRLSLSRRR